MTTQPATHTPVSEDGVIVVDDLETMEIIPQSAPPPSGTPVPSPEIGMPFLPGQVPADASARWLSIQAQFVDDPRKAVGDAHTMAGELIRRILDTVANQRSDLAREWSEDEDVSTEELRVCLQRYRDFIARLASSASEFEQTSHESA